MSTSQGELPRIHPLFSFEVRGSHSSTPLQNTPSSQRSSQAGPVDEDPEPESVPISVSVPEGPVPGSVVVPVAPLVEAEDSLVSLWDVELVVAVVPDCDVESVDGPPDPLLLEPSVPPVSPDVEPQPDETRMHSAVSQSLRMCQGYMPHTRSSEVLEVLVVTSTSEEQCSSAEQTGVDTRSAFSKPRCSDVAYSSGERTDR